MTLRSDGIKHQIFLQRVIKTQIKDLQGVLNKGKRELEKALENQASNLKIKQIVVRTMKATTPIINHNLRELALYEAKFQTKLLQKHSPNVVIKPPSAKQVLASLTAKEVAYTTAGATFSVAATTAAIATGLTTKIVKQIGVTRLIAGASLTGVTGVFGSFALVKLASTISTWVNAAAATAKTETYKQNNIEMVVWRTELDSAVCEDCASNEGEELTVDEFDDAVPVHANCRCFSEPIL